MKRTYSKDFKIKACELVIKNGTKHAVVAEKMGINKVMLYRWIDEYETHGEEAFVGKGHQRSEDAELRKLRKENERLKMEMEILKKQRHTLRNTRQTSKIRKSRTEKLQNE